jgi:two-component system LytT family sensor kinase
MSRDPLIPSFTMTLRKRLTNFGIALVSVWLAMAAYALLQSLSGLLTLHHYEFQAWDVIRSNTVYVWVPLLPLTPLVFWLASRYPIMPGNLGMPLLKHLGTMCVFALLHGYESALLYYYIGWIDEDMIEYEAWQHTGHFLFTDNSIFLLDTLIYCILVASQNITNFHKLVQQKDLDAVRMQGQLAESKLQALLMQINPHFLFNTLNSISVLVQKHENAKAQEMLVRLSDFFRQTLDRGEEQCLPLRKELTLVEQYLAIEQIRFGDRLEVEYQVEPACLDTRVPVLILQPLVENAIKHGLSRKVGTCHLRISASMTPDGVALKVSDDGVGMALQQTRDGVGLSNVKNRLRALYAERHQFLFNSTPGQGTEVSIVLGALA